MEDSPKEHGDKGNLNKTLEKTMLGLQLAGQQPTFTGFHQRFPKRTTFFYKLKHIMNGKMCVST